MQTSADRTRRTVRALALSLVFHSAFFVFVFLFGTRARVVILQPVHPMHIAQLAISGGSHRIRIELPPSNFAAHTPQPDAYADSSKKTSIPIPNPPVQKSGGGSPRVPHHGDGSSKALRGNGSDLEDIVPAFPVYSPHPPVRDRSLLPSTEQKVVVDVDVNEVGQVVSEKLVKGMGTVLDKLVLDTVKTWRFQPATIHGKPVASEAELIFPFNRDYPIADS